MSHTPGPWHIVDTLDSEDDDVPPSIEVLAGKQFVASLNDIHDANLIAAAPDLLEALKAILNDEKSDCRKSLADQARAAILKAEGK